MNFCAYYQAHVVPHEAWFFVGIVRSFEHLCFDRTFDVNNSVFEFFVPAAVESSFIEIMHHFQRSSIITDFRKLPNRLSDPNETV